MNKLIPLSALALTAACGGGGGSTGPEVTTISAEEELTRLFTDDVGETQQALLDGETLTSRSVATSVVSRDRDAETITPVTADSQVSLAFNTSGALTVEIDGKTTEFTAADATNIYGFQTFTSGDDYTDVYSWNGTMAEFLANEDVMKTIEYYQAANGREITGFAVLGTETADDALAALAAATYSGRFTMDLLPTEGMTTYGDDRDRVRGDVSMQADFAAGTISGTMSGMTVEDFETSTTVDLPGTATMDEAVFDVNGYTGTLTPDATLSSEIEGSFGGTYSGAFYGSAAEGTGGALRGMVSSPDGDEAAYGFFRGWKE